MTWDERVAIIENVTALPVSQKIEEIMYGIDSSMMSIIVAPTGTGKTTVVPAKMMLKHPKKQITTTVPRVIAAMSTSSRASQILLAETGDPRYSLGVDV